MIKKVVNSSIGKRFISSIQEVKGRMILDSRGYPTVEVDVTTEKGVFRASVPSGLSPGIHEAVEIRDGGNKFMGLGVNAAIKNINEIIAPHIVGMNPISQESVDNMLITLDGTDNKSKLGCNAMFAASMATAKAGAAGKGISLYKHISELCDKENIILPVPIVNLISNKKENAIGLGYREINIMPVRASTLRDGIKISLELYKKMKDEIRNKYGIDKINVTENGGFMLNANDIRESIELILNNLNILGFNDLIKLTVDFNACDYYKDKEYELRYKDNKLNRKIKNSELMKMYQSLIEDYPIVTLEDPFDNDDWKAYTKFVELCGDKIQIIGDQLIESNTHRLTEAIGLNACNGLLLKPNQVGTLSETIEACLTAQCSEWGVIMSHRSGETEDTYLSDLSVGLNTGQIKTGSLTRSERVSKINELLRIEEELGKDGIYAGENYMTAATI